MALTAKKIIEDFQLELVCGEAGLDNEVTKHQITRPGIELAGLFDFYEKDRIQILGSKEITFFSWLNQKDQEERVTRLFAEHPPMFVFSKNMDIPDIFVQKGNEYKIPIVRADRTTSDLMSSLYLYLSAHLAERITVHGVLLDISGVGVLIQGKSGLGKSEVALELVRRGHQLVADDRVDIYQRELGVVVGEAPELTKRYLEIRGIGIVNVVKLFGAKAFKDDKKIMLVIELEPWNSNADYDRLGLENETVKYFDTEVAYVKIPISEGRNVASLVEAAAVTARLKFLGENAAQEFADALAKEIERKNNEE